MDNNILKIIFRVVAVLLLLVLWYRTYTSFIYDYYYYLVCSIPNKEDYKYEIIIDILI